MKKLDKVAGSEEKFYGYIKGIRVESDSNYETSYAVATFHYNGFDEDYMIDDQQLLSKLYKHHRSMAFLALQKHEWGMDKLFISYKDNQWIVELP
jgi:hypothetical protein